MGYQPVKPHGQSFVLFCFVPFSFGDITNLEKKIQNFFLIKFTLKIIPQSFLPKNNKIVPTLSHEALEKNACNFHQR
jgi:hypothetical protein